MDLQGVQLIFATSDGIADGILAVSKHGYLLLDLLVLLLLVVELRAAGIHLLTDRTAAQLLLQLVSLAIFLLIFP